MSWQKVVNIGPQSEQSKETWKYHPPGGSPRDYLISVKTGKKFDVVGLKGTNLQETKEYAGFLKAAIKKLYGNASALKVIENCPCCNGSMKNADPVLTVHGAEYVSCTVCGHVFVSKQPTKEMLETVFSDSEDHSSAYIDPELVESRLKQIIFPKIDWVLDVYQKQYSSRPEKAVDVGAGGGHFVAGINRAGIFCEGYELSKASRDFAKQAFNLDLKNKDFTSENETYDLITFWGLLEYVPDPVRFLQAAKDQLSTNSGMLVIEVPRYEALGTAVQSVNTETIARHMDPSSHVNCFTDASLATLLVEAGFSPVAVWYFGMDVYEMLVQSALRLGDDEVIMKLGDMIPVLQARLDAGRQCDDIVIAAVPA